VVFDELFFAELFFDEPFFDELFFADGFFFTVFVDRRDCLSGEDFFVRLVVALFEALRLLFVFFFMGMEAVYHHAKPHQYHR
jgi:hypothetical protein